MDSSQAVSLMLNSRIDREHELLNKVVRKFSEFNIAGADQALELIPASLKSLNDRKFDELLDQWMSYISPIFTIGDWVTIVQRNAMDIHLRQKNRERGRLLSKYRAAVDQPNPEIRCFGNAQANMFDQFLIEPNIDQTSIPPSLAVESTEYIATQHIVRDNKSTFAVCPNSLERLKIPIQYTYTPNLSDMFDSIVYFPMTKIINLSESLKNCLNKGQELGYSRKQMMVVLKSFVETHYKEFYVTIQPLQNPHECFKAILSLIHAHSILPVINSQLKTLTRTPRESVHQFYAKHKSLLQVKLENVQPHLSTHQIATKAQNIAKQSLCNFLEQRTKHCYLQYLRIQNENGEAPTIEDSLIFIRDLEASAPEYQLQTPKTNNQDQDVNLFQTNVSALVTTRSMADPSQPRKVYNVPKNKNRPIPVNYAQNSTRNKMTLNTPRQNTGTRPKTVTFSPNVNQQQNQKRNFVQRTSQPINRLNFRSPQTFKRQNFSVNASKLVNNPPNPSYRNSRNFKNNVGIQNNRFRNKPYNSRRNQNKQLSEKKFQSRFSHFMEKEFLKGRLDGDSQNASSGTPRCLRCLGPHPDHSCTRYHVTTASPCTKCGSQAFHYSKICQGRYPK